METSPFNPGARRRKGGIWNEEVLAVTVWELADCRVVLPLDLQLHIGAPTAVLRWSRAKRESMLAARPRTQELLDTINQTIKGWRYVGREPDETIMWHVLFENGGHWNDLVLGPDRSGSWNVITLHPLRDRQFRILLESGWVEGGCK